MSRQLTYKDAGVNIDAGNELVQRIKPAAARTRRPEMLGGIGGFAGLMRLPAGYDRPVLVSGTDGVGTKLRLAIRHNRHDHIGQDLVAMCVNDVLVTGAEPLLFLDYYATSRLDVDVAARVVEGIAAACELAGCSLAGGETAEMPGMYHDGDYDLAGFCVGVVNEDAIIDGTTLAPGQKLIGLASSGAHSNGYSLINRLLDEQGDGISPNLIDQLLEPTRLYVRSILALLKQVPVHGMSHITGGGLLENLPRMFRGADLAARIDLDSWQRPDLFNVLQQAGNIAELEMLRTFNCGLGFVVVVDATDEDRALALLREAGETAWTAGELVALPADPESVSVAAGELLLWDGPSHRLG